MFRVSGENIAPYGKVPPIILIIEILQKQQLTVFFRERWDFGLVG